MTTESPTEKQCRLATGRCCWHCHYYVRPVEYLQLDGPEGNICTVERLKGQYPGPGSLYAGDNFSDPDFYCDRFEMDLPPEADKKR